MFKNIAKGILGGDALFGEQPVAKPAASPATGKAAPQPVKKKQLVLGTSGVGAKSKKPTEALPVPRDRENRHFLICGTTGAGKTRLFFQLADQARDRGDKALIVDHGMEQVMRNWRPGDIILNPFDARFPGWTPFSEADAPWDCDNLGRFLVPDGIGSAAEWNGYAQRLIAAIIKKITDSADGDGICTETNDELVRWAIAATNEELQAFCAGDTIQALLDPNNAKMLGSIRGIISDKLAPFRYLNDGDFSLRDWAMNDDDKRWVFICYRDEMLGSLRSLISCWVSLVVMYLLSLPESSERKFWLFLDELGSLDKIAALPDAMTKARKRGGIVVAGLQAISNLKEKYGNDGTTTLLSNFGTWLSLRCGDADTAEVFSKHFGKQEIWQDGFNQGMNFGQGATMNDGVNLQLREQHVITFTEMMELPDLAGFIKIGGPYPSGEITAPIVPPPKDRGTEAFIPATKGKAAFKSRRAAKQAARQREQLEKQAEKQAQVEIDMSR
jgi:hypothetical protein